MCMMLYMASDKKLPTIPWNKNIPDFYIEELNKRNQEFLGVRKQVNKPYIYYVGAHTGCGCGFYYDMSEVFDESSLEENKMNRRSVENLFLYIRENLINEEEFKLYSCWAGDERSQCEKQTIININSFILGDSFSFDENELIIVKFE